MLDVGALWKSEVLVKSLALTLLLLSSIPAAHAQPTDAELGDVAPFIALFPELRGKPAPSWLVEGVRVSYQSASAVIGSETPASGSGIIQFDIIAATGAEVFTYQHAYGNDGQGTFPLYTGSYLGLPGLGIFWMHPSVLGGAQSDASAGLTVTRYTKSVAGKDTPVVRFETQTTSGTTVYEFDADTGLIVFESVAAGQSLGQLTLLSVRQLELPWGPSRAPRWVREGAQSEYSGTQSVAIPAAGTTSMPVGASARVDRSGARWSLDLVTATVNGQVQGTAPTATGEAQIFGGLWLPRAALELRPPAEGQRIDQDPVTGAEVWFGSGEDNTLVLQQLTALARITAVYDGTSGVLLRKVVEQQSAAAVTTIDISRVGGSDLAALSQEPEVPEDPAAGSDPNGPGDPADPGTPGAPNAGGSSRPGCEGGGGSAAALGMLLVAAMFRRTMARAR